MLLLDLLLSEGKISDLDSKEISAALLTNADKSVDELLAAKKVSETDIANSRALLYGLTVYDHEVPKDKDPNLLKILSLEQSKQFRAVPISFKDELLSVGIVDPDHANAMNALQFAFNEKLIAYKLYIITWGQYESYVGKPKVEEKPSAKPNTEVKKKEEKKEGDGDNEIIDLTSYDGNISDDLLNQPVPEIWNQVLKHAILAGASDIHVEHMGPTMRIRIRVDGSLKQILSTPPSFHSVLIARIKILCQLKLDEKRKPQDGRFTTREEDYKIDYRVSTFPSYYGEKVVLRILDSHKGIRPLDTVGLSKRHWEQVQEAINKPYGIILISGPTGSGKTTTLYSMLGQVDREHRNVVSLEDPVEYNITGINQSQVFPEIGYTFASGLRSILRQDPDVILVGEIRDAETAGLAIQAALTGHLVFSTIHTNTAIGVITRLLDMGIEPYLIAPTLNAAVGQRLVRGIAPGCAKAMPQDGARKAMIDTQFKDLPDSFKKDLPLSSPFMTVQGNDEYPEGMKGRMPVFEILTVTDQIERAILDKKGDDDLYKLAREQGMLTMKEDAMIKCIEGKVPFEEINTL